MVKIIGVSETLILKSLARRERRRDELFSSDKLYIDNLKANGIDFANSLQELQNLLK